MKYVKMIEGTIKLVIKMIIGLLTHLSLMRTIGCPTITIANIRMRNLIAPCQPLISVLSS